MKKILVIILFFCTKLEAQNLIVNPSFEDTLTCAQWNDFPLLQCAPWYESIGSADFFTVVTPTSCGAAPIPNNSLGYQMPRTGLNCSGFEASYFPIGIDVRECITGKLNGLLINNHSYFVKFYINPGDNCRLFVDKIGAYFSIDSINPDTANVFNMIPQVENPTGNIITDSINWTEISGYFIAQGGERWITIGNFRTDLNTNFDSSLVWTEDYSYYYLDDVSVVDCTATGINELQQVNFLLSPNPCNSYVEINAEVAIEEVSVYNLMMEKIKQESINSALNFRVDMADLPKGIYFIKIITKDKRTGYKKFIKL